MNEKNPGKKLENKFKDKRVLITGGLGMIGSNLAHKLVEYNAEVTLIDACIDPYGYNLFNIKGIKDKVYLNITDIRDRESIKFLIKEKDIIFNLAAQVSHNDSIENPFLDADINYIGHLNVLENLKKYNPKAHIFFAGSRLQFGKIEKNPVNEDHPLRPETPYAFNKTAAENMYHYYHEIHGIPTTTFRIANPYGIRCQMKHSKYSIINYFIRLAMENQTIKIFGDGEQMRDYIYVDDLVNAFLLAAASENSIGQTFNLGSGTGSRFNDMVSTIVEVVGKGKIEYIPWPDNYLNVETGDYITDITKINRMLGWHPLIELKQGIELTTDYYKKYKDYYF